jgi:hypothetical protein
MTTRHALPPSHRRSRMALAKACAALVSAALMAPLVHAQMADPTRPALGNPANRPQAQAYVSPNLPMPGGAGQGMGQGPGAAPQAQAGAPPRGAHRTASGSPRLSSVMVGPPTVACAVIDGQVVRVGERIRGDRGEVLVQVDRLGVLLRSSQGSTRLNLMSRTELPAAAKPQEAAAPEVAASSPNAPPANATPPADTPGATRKETP